MSRVAFAAAVTIQCRTRVIMAKQQLRVLHEAEAQRQAAAAVMIGSMFRALLAKKEIENLRQCEFQRLRLVTKTITQSQVSFAVGVWLRRVLIVAAFVALTRSVSSKPIFHSAVSIIQPIIPIAFEEPPSTIVSKLTASNMTSTVAAILRNQFSSEHMRFAIESM
jgi:hypothetical protein